MVKGAPGLWPTRSGLTFAPGTGAVTFSSSRRAGSRSSVAGRDFSHCRPIECRSWCAESFSYSNGLRFVGFFAFVARVRRRHTARSRHLRNSRYRFVSPKGAAVGHAPPRSRSRHLRNSRYRSVSASGCRCRACDRRRSGPATRPGLLCRPGRPGPTAPRNTGTPETAEDCGRLRKIVERTPSVCNRRRNNRLRNSGDSGSGGWSDPCLTMEFYRQELQQPPRCRRDADLYQVAQVISAGGRRTAKCLSTLRIRVPAICATTWRGASVHSAILSQERAAPGCAKPFPQVAGAPASACRSCQFEFPQFALPVVQRPLRPARPYAWPPSRDAAGRQGNRPCASP